MTKPLGKKDNRIRGRRLQRIRKEHLEANPICVECEKNGIYTLATDVDHIVALINGGKDVPENRQSLCNPCHKEKTKRDMNYKQRVKIGDDGYPIEG